MDLPVRCRPVGQQPLKLETEGAGVRRGGSQGGMSSQPVYRKMWAVVPEGGAGLVGLSVGRRAVFH